AFNSCLRRAIRSASSSSVNREYSSALFGASATLINQDLPSGGEKKSGLVATRAREGGHPREPVCSPAARRTDQTVNELPQPQPPLAFGLLKVKPEPWNVVT